MRPGPPNPDPTQRSRQRSGLPCTITLMRNWGLTDQPGIAQAPAIAEEDITIMFATNVTGLINMTQEVLKIYKKRDEGGRGDIINIGSIAGREPYSGGSIYCSTKAAVRSFTDSLRKELINTRVRVMEIDPGQVETVCHALCPIERPKVSILTLSRSSPSSDSTATRQRPMPSTREMELAQNI